MPAEKKLTVHFVITFGIAIVKRSFSVLFFPDLLSFIWLTTIMKSSRQPPKVSTEEYE